MNLTAIQSKVTRGNYVNVKKSVILSAEKEQLEKKHVSGTAGVFYSDKSARTRTRAGILPTSSAYTL